MTLHRLGRDVQFSGDALVRVAARDESQHLALAGGYLVKLGVPAGVGVGAARSVGERLEDKAGESRGEDGVARPHSPDGVDQVSARDVLGDVAAGARPDDRDDVLGGVGDREGEEANAGTSGAGGADLAQDSQSASIGHVHVQEDHVGLAFDDHLHGGGDIVGVPDDVDRVGDLGPYAGADELVVVD